MDAFDRQYPDISSYSVESIWLDTAPKPRTLLVCYPHPDDESFYNGGTLSRYGAQGVAVHYVCATRGECGLVDSKLLKDYADTAALRTAEQECAARALGLAAVHFLGYRDSGMRGAPDNLNPAALIQAPMERVVSQLVMLIRALRPQVVLTFNAHGGYGHPDHIYLHHAVRAAFPEAGDPAGCPDQIAAGLAPWQPTKLYYPTSGATFVRTAAAALRRFGVDLPRFSRNAKIIPVTEVNTLITTTIDCAHWSELNIRAKMCHRSQVGGMPVYYRLPRVLTRRMLAAEHFTRAIPAWDAGERERDLFTDA